MQNKIPEHLHLRDDGYLNFSRCYCTYASLLRRISENSSLISNKVDAG